MNVKKAIKKVAALGAATAMVGATLFGAMAYDLDDYPAPFVMDGVFNPAESVVVVGEDAAVSDVLGAIEIAASLQADAVTVEPVEVAGSVDPTVSEGVKIAKSGNDLNYNEKLSDIDSKMTDSDLPDLLADGTYDESEGNTDNEVDYDQEISWGTATAELEYEQNDDTEVTGTYLKFTKNQDLYVYTFDFNGGTVDFDTSAVNDDFEGSTLDFQGTAYTITAARDDSDNNIDRLKLLVGDVVRWVSQDAPVNVGDSTVTVVSVDENGGKCGVEVDGEVKWLSTGETKTVGSLEVGVLDAIAVHSELADQDTCELSLGSQELILEDGEEVKVDGNDVDGAIVAFRNDSSQDWDGFTITYTPEDDMWLAPGEEWQDPVFGNWKLMFDSLTSNTEMVTLEAGSSEGELVFYNIDGVKVTVPFREDSGSTYVGWGDDEDLFNVLNGGNNADNGSIVFSDDDYCDGDDLAVADDVTGCEGVLVLAVSSGHEARLLELTDIDTNDLEVSFKDLSPGGETYTETYADNVETDIDVGFMEIAVTITDATNRIVFNTVDAGDVKTELGAVLTLGVSTTADDVGLFIHLDEDSDSTLAIGFNTTVTQDSSDDDLEITSPEFAVDGLTLAEEEEGADDYIGATTYGTLVRWDEDNKDKLEVTYPEEEVYANVFVSPVGAEVVSAGGSSVNTENVHKIGVGMAVLDVDAESMDANMVVVGGPCANILADEVTGEKESCVEGFEEGKAKIAVYDRAGKTVVLVAGYSSQDTLAASRVLALHEEYPQLTGSAVELAVASLSDVAFVGAE